MSLIIQSVDNQRIKVIKKLQQKKYRDLNNEFIIEGEKALQEALERNILQNYYVINEIYISESFSFKRISEQSLGNIQIYTVTDKVFSNISNVKSPQGCLAIIRYKQMELSEVIDRPIANMLDSSVNNKVLNNKLIIILDAIQDPGNLGTIIRIADAVGVRAIILGNGCSDAYSDKVVRSAMGSLFHVPIIQKDIIDAIAILKRSKYHIMAADLQGNPYYSIEPCNNIALIMGNEGSGLSEIIRQHVQSYVSIPMPGQAESLNVAVATAVLAFDLVRIWQK
jgi:TrmH family RNA methyltransferase